MAEEGKKEYIWREWEENERVRSAKGNTRRKVERREAEGENQTEKQEWDEEEEKGKNKERKISKWTGRREG